MGYIKKILKIMFFVLCMCYIFIGCERANDIVDKDRHNNEKGSIDNLEEDVGVYIDEKFGFSVEYPKQWGSKVEPTWEATSEREASPDGGINIYIEGKKDELIYVFGQHGHIGIGESNSEKEEFITNKGVSGYLYSQYHDGKMIRYLILGSGFQGAYINVSDELYSQYEQQIMDILRSIEILE